MWRNSEFIHLLPLLPAPLQLPEKLAEEIEPPFCLSCLLSMQLKQPFWVPLQQVSSFLPSTLPQVVHSVACSNALISVHNSFVCVCVRVCCGGVVFAGRCVCSPVYIHQSPAGLLRQ